MELEGGSNIIPMFGETGLKARSKLFSRQHAAGEHLGIIGAHSQAIAFANEVSAKADRLHEHLQDVNKGKTTFDPRIAGTNPATGNPHTVESLLKLHGEVVQEVNQLGERAGDLILHCPECRREHHAFLEADHAEGYHHPDVDGPHDECPSCIAGDEAASPSEPSAEPEATVTPIFKNRNERNSQSIFDVASDYHEERGSQNNQSNNQSEEDDK